MMAKRLESRSHYEFASPGYLAMHGAPHTLSEPEQNNCLQNTVGYWRFRESGKARHIRVNGTIHCNSGRRVRRANCDGRWLPMCAIWGGTFAFLSARDQTARTYCTAPSPIFTVVFCEASLTKVAN